MNQASTYLHTINLLRGVAALMVVVVHFAGTGFLDESWITKISSYGQHGVIIFFVISGFIIPYALSNKNYAFRDFNIFLCRRLVRLNPPYYLAIILTLVLSYAASSRSETLLDNLFAFDIQRFLLHLTYLIPFTDKAWYTNIYWTLAIEFQFYLFIGLLFPLLIMNKYASLCGLIIICFSQKLPQVLTFLPPLTILNYSTPFILGIILFLWRKNYITRLDLFLVSPIVLLLCKDQISGTRMLFALFAYFMILLVNHQSKISDFLGKISYSLYLTHSLIFVFFQAIAINFINFSLPFTKEIFVLLLIPLSVLFANIFYHAIERPSIELSNQLAKL